MLSPYSSINMGRGGVLFEEKVLILILANGGGGTYLRGGSNLKI